MSKPTIRGSSAPQKAIVKRTETLATFFQRLGRVTYGSDWRHPNADAETVGSAQIGTPEEMADIVRGQIIAGIQAGKVKLIQSCSLEALRPKALPKPGATAAIPKIRAPIDDDEGEPYWQALSANWDLETDIDWGESTARVKCSEIFDTRNKRNLLDDYEESDRSVVIHLAVDDPDKTIRSLIDYGELPDADWFDKYNRYVKIEMRECIAVAWRSIVFSSLENKYGVQEQLVIEMNKYASHRKFEISEDALRNIARKIVKQWDERDLRARLFVNSSR